MDNIIPFKSREVKHCPPHFIKVAVEVLKDNSLQSALGPHPRETPQCRIRNWCHENISNRFFIGEDLTVAAGFMVETFIVGFEVESDATYFTLLKQSFVETE